MGGSIIPVQESPKLAVYDDLLLIKEREARRRATQKTVMFLVLTFSFLNFWLVERKSMVKSF
jgi:hypothetical protein